MDAINERGETHKRNTTSGGSGQGGAVKDFMRKHAYNQGGSPTAGVDAQRGSNNENKMDAVAQHFGDKERPSGRKSPLGAKDKNNSKMQRNKNERAVVTASNINSRNHAQADHKPSKSSTSAINSDADADN